MSFADPPVALRWAGRLAEFLPGFLRNHPALSAVAPRADVLLSGSTTLPLAHGLRACLALEGEPYPYDKWLWRVAAGTPTGQKLAPSVERLMGHLAADALRFPGPESDNPLSQELKAFRRELVDAARGRGVDEPWLDRWWLHVNQARAATRGLRW